MPTLLSRRPAGFPVWAAVAAFAASAACAAPPDEGGVPPGEAPQRPAAVVQRDSAGPGASSTLPGAAGPPVEVYEAADWRPPTSSPCGDAALPRASGGESEVTVFFACVPRDGAYSPAVPARTVNVPPGRDPRETAIRTLLGGPTDDERRRGYASPFGSESADVGFDLRMDADTVTVDFDREVLEVPMIFVGRATIAQLVGTLSQFPEVRFVRVRVGGEPLCRVLQEC